MNINTVSLWICALAEVLLLLNVFITLWYITHHYLTTFLRQHTKHGQHSEMVQPEAV